MERKVRISGHEILLVSQPITQPEEIVKGRRPNLDALGKLNRSGLAGQAGCRGFGVKHPNRRTRLAGAWTNIHKASIDFAEEAGIQTLIERLHRVPATDDFAHAIERAAVPSCCRPQGKVSELIQRDGLGPATTR